MNSSFLTKNLAKLSLAINITLTVIFWLWCIGTSDPIFFNLMQAYTFIDADAIKIIVTVICAISIIRSITAYEARVIQFIQADLLKEILEEVKSSGRRKRMDEIDKEKDMKVDFDNIKI